MSLHGILASKGTRSVLIGLNALVALGVTLAFRNALGGDAGSYTALADGILHGIYSMWWFLPVEIPDTFRNPGYPLLIAFFRAFSNSIWPIQVFQYCCYAAAVALTLRIIVRLGGGIRGQNLLLLILLPSINVPYFIPGLFPEIPTLLLVCAFVAVEIGDMKAAKKGLVLALLAGLAFQMRSSLLVFPLFWLLMRGGTLIQHRRILPALIFIGTFALTLVPFSLWNLKHHGVFKPTSLEGGAGVAHFGWWAGKIPGHVDHWYWWGNRTGVEIIPFADEAAIPDNVLAYESEWAAIDSSLRPKLNALDTLMLDSAANYIELAHTYNAEYTLAREHALWQATISHALDEPGYTVAYKAYSAVRLWVTGIQMDRWRATSGSGLLAELYPFLITGFVFLLALVLVPLACFRVAGHFKRIAPLLVWLFYFGAIHLPFVIQARYTAPARLILFAAIALSIDALWRNRLASKTAPPF